ncbi:MAG TPA: fatty acid desaturase [Verrucomicrobiae bacterium]|nr:fatty acid desaturase [Verrucomicrobiae bacterium]
MKLKTDTLIGFILCHSLALLALFPWFFSWTGVALLAVGMYVFGVLGINVGFHRLLAHRSFSCPRWLEHSLAFLGTCSLQFSPAFWVAVHRRHHRFADEERDPHSPLKSFFWAHFGWLLVRTPDMRPGVMTERYAKDLMRDPFYAMIERRKNWMKITFLSWVAFFVLGFAGDLLAGATFSQAFQLGASLFIWAGALRTVLVWHTTWSVNSVTHIWGYRNYETPDRSRNNPIVGLLAAGEGWHNNHHAAPTSARHGHKWWEIDLAWMTIRALMAFGLATEVILPAPTLSASYK